MNDSDGRIAAATTQLSDAWRILGRLGYIDTIFNHISAAYFDTEGRFKISMNPDGFFPSEVLPDRIVTFAFEECSILNPDSLGINRDGFELHSAIHRARMSPGTVLHTHSPYASAIGATSDGLLSLSQTAMEFALDAKFIEYEGLFRKSLADQKLNQFWVEGGVAFLRNHGTLIVTDEVEEAIYIQHFIEEACKIQVYALSQGKIVSVPSDNTVRESAAILKRDRCREAKKLFQAFKRTILTK